VHEPPECELCRSIAKPTGTDQDGDGVGDTPYRVLGEGIEYDRAPAMAPHHPNAETEWNLCGIME